MKRLILLRHAKAVPAQSGPDHARDLDSRGVADAAWAGATLAAAGWTPDTALVSDALRTRHTFDLARPHFAKQPTLRLEPRLYDASCRDILASIGEMPDAAACLMVVGHNPGIAETAIRLARSGGAAASEPVFRSFPTAALAVFAVEGAGWRGLGSGKATLDAFFAPH